MKHSTNPSPTGGKVTSPSVPNVGGPARGESGKEALGKKDGGGVRGSKEQGMGGQRKGYGERKEGGRMGAGMSGGKEKGPGRGKSTVPGDNRYKCGDKK